MPVFVLFAPGILLQVMHMKVYQQFQCQLVLVVSTVISHEVIKNFLVHYTGDKTELQKGRGHISADPA